MSDTAIATFRSSSVVIPPSPCRSCKDNQVQLQLFTLAHNLDNFQRRLAQPRSGKDWSLKTLQEKSIRIGAKMVEHEARR